MSVKTPVKAHTNNTQPPPPTVLEISALTIKMPEPIIDPITSIVESNRPKCLLNSVDCCAEDWDISIHYLMIKCMSYTRN